MMKRAETRIGAIALCLSLLALSPLVAEKEYKLSESLQTAAAEIAEKLPANTKVVVVGITCEDAVAGEILAEDLTYELLQTGKLIMVDRSNIDLIRKELDFQMSGDVSDESSQRLGSMLGAEILITGSFEKRGNNYRFSLKAVRIETAQIQYITRLNVDSNAETETLFNRKTGSDKAVEVAAAGAKTAIGFTGRFLAMCVNPLLGVGSLAQGDTDGMRRVVFWELAGVGSMIYGSQKIDTDEDKGTFWTTAGVVMFSGAVVYSWIRPWVYNRSPSTARTLDRLNIQPVFAQESGSRPSGALTPSGFRAGYTLTY